MKKPNLRPNLAVDLKAAAKEKAARLGELKPSEMSAGLLGGSKTGPSLLAAAVVLLLVFGIAELRSPISPRAVGTGGTASDAKVERTSLVCPEPRQDLTGSTTLTLFTPGDGSATGGSAVLNNVQQAAAAPAQAPVQAPAAGATPGAPAADALVALAKTGVPVTGNALNGDQAPGTFAVAGGAFAPGFTVTQVTTATDPKKPGISGVQCSPSGTNFWFAGASSVDARTDYVVLVNAEPVPAVVDLHLIGPKGPIDVETASGITLAPGSSQALRLNTYAPGLDDLAVNVVARSGRVGAFVHAVDAGKGRDWLPAMATPTPTQVIPGLPADVSTAHLVVAAPGADDADLKIQISGKNGWFTPAGNETIHVKAGMVQAVDLNAVTHGEAGALRLTPSDATHNTPVVAGLRVNRDKNGKSEAAWLAGADPVGARASIADNRGGATTLYLTSTDKDAKVKVTSSAGSGGGTPASKEVVVPAGVTVAVDNPDPADLKGVYGLTVETVSGGPVVAARMITVMNKDYQMFTTQLFRDDHSTFRLPQTSEDAGVLLNR